jgi:cytochrome P450/catechol 2,3-dioxygenase-like lactoylglutathione lyase family enzyme
MAPSPPATTAALPRGPKGHALLGNLGDLNRDQLGFYLRCAREHGDVVPVRLGPRRGLLVYHPDAVEEVLVVRNRDFIKSPGVRLLRRLLGDGLVVSEGESWLRQRRLMQPAFHRQRIASYGEIMAACAARQMEGWHEGAVLDIHDEMMGVTRAIVASALFGADVSDEARAVGDASEIVMEYFGERLGSLLALLPAWLPTPSSFRLRRAIRRLDEVVYRMIADRRRSGEDRGDLLTLLLQAQDADDGSRMSDRQMRDEVMTLFLAGHETTAVALSWAWYLLARHSESDARLADELHALLAGRPPAVSDVPTLRYTEMVVTESMRLYPPAYAMGRQAARPTEVAGQPLGAGDVVIIPTWAIHRDARWFDDPEAFRPERWASDAARRLPRFAYLPFGGGPRQCIGNTFATMEAVLVLATIPASACAWSFVERARPCPGRGAGVTMAAAVLTRIDHLMICVPDLAKGVDAYRRIGFDVHPGGAHSSGGTENAIAFLQDDYLELLGVREGHAGEASAGLREFLAAGGGLRYVCVQSDDLAADVAAMRARGVDVSDPAEGGRRTPAGQDLRWRAASLGAGNALPIFFVQHLTPLAERKRQVPRAGQHPNGVLRVERAYVTVTDVAREAATYARVLGMAVPTVVRGNVIKADMAVFEIGPTGLGVAQPAESGPAAEALARRGPGPFQVLYRTRSMDAAARHMAGHGLPPPARGVRNTGEQAMLVGPLDACDVYIGFVGPA